MAASFVIGNALPNKELSEELFCGFAGVTLHVFQTTPEALTRFNSIFGFR